MTEPDADLPNADVAERLRLIRRAMGWRQSEMTAHLGMSTQRWFNYETGMRSLPFKVASDLKRLTGVTLDYVYLGDTRELTADFRRRVGEAAVTQPLQWSKLPTASTRDGLGVLRVWPWLPPVYP